MTFTQRHSDVPDAVKEERPDDVYKTIYLEAAG